MTPRRLRRLLPLPSKQKKDPSDAERESEYKKIALNQPKMNEVESARLLAENRAKFRAKFEPKGEGIRMDDASEAFTSDVVMRPDGEGLKGSDAVETVPSTTLVEVTPGVAVVFGEVPDGLELIRMDLVPSFDRMQLATALGSIGNVGTVVGNLAEAVSSAQGLYRVNDATLALLKSGGEMAAKPRSTDVRCL